MSRRRKFNFFCDKKHPNKHSNKKIYRIVFFSSMASYKTKKKQNQKTRKEREEKEEKRKALKSLKHWGSLSRRKSKREEGEGRGCWEEYS